MNTIWADRRGVYDAIVGPADLTTWFTANGLGVDAPEVTERDWVRTRELRDALRRLAALRTGDVRSAAASAITDPSAAVDVVNELAKGLGAPQLALAGDVVRRATSSGGRSVDAALADVAVQAVELLTDNDAPPLRACLAPGCVLYFVKHHPRREWCSVACGNRARAARHYHRHNAASGT
jgi:predicted RNA-binding Zn ribbon-like protein